MLTNREVPKSKYDEIYSYSNINFRGSSFLLHPEALIYHRYKYSYRDIAIYIALASYRPYANYVVNKTLSLDLAVSPVDPRLYLDNKDLIPVENGVLHFIYEENPYLFLQH